MVLFVVIALLAGCALSSFRVQILLPIGAFMLIGLVTSGLLQSDSPGRIAIAALAAFAALQLGYLAGVVISYALSRRSNPAVRPLSESLR